MKILSCGSLNYDCAQIIDGVLPAYDVPESALSDYLRPDWSNACINVRTEEAYETAHEVLRGGRTVSGHIGSSGFARSGAGGPQTGESGKEHRGHRPGQRHEISVYADVLAEMIKTR